ncbi:MAG: type II secretion system protein [Phycisphaerae bacterium]|nr:type II secretion system protein [Phycisphaerae bacterium]
MVPRTTTTRRGLAFTLIELLVVVAIIALLMSILLPTLGAAKGRARQVMCRNNMRQLSMAFVRYANDYMDLLPGNAFDRLADWLGPANAEGPGLTDEQLWYNMDCTPEKGTIFPYMGQQPKSYFCPDHERFPQDGSTPVKRYSYTSPMILTGAPIDLPKRCLIQNPRPNERCRPANWRTATDTLMVPIVVEEDVKYHLESVRDSGWSNVDGITSRHKGKGHLGFLDGHVEMRWFRRGGSPPPNYERFTAWHMWLEVADKHVTVGRYTDADGYGITMGFLQKNYNKPGVYSP